MERKIDDRWGLSSKDEYALEDGGHSLNEVIEYGYGVIRDLDGELRYEYDKWNGFIYHDGYNNELTLKLNDTSVPQSGWELE